MTLKKTRTCNNCKALDVSGNLPRCELWYPIRNEYDKKSGVFLSCVPKAMCPKPKTIREFLDAEKYSE